MFSMVFSISGVGIGLLNMCIRDYCIWVVWELTCFFVNFVR